jgi:hypothetical protein
MPHPRPYPRCIWCGARANSREHAIPKWIGERLGIKEMMTGTVTGDVPPIRHKVSFRSHRKHIFCKKCNRHFGLLEERVIPLLEPMARGQSVSLDQDARSLLALWAVKTGIALLAAHDRYKGIVPPAAWVGYANWTGVVGMYAYEGNLAADGPHGASAQRGYTAVLGFRDVAFVMLALSEPTVPDSFAIGNPRPSSIIQFWPPTAGSLQWPPPCNPADAEAIGNLGQLLPLVPS